MLLKNIASSVSLSLLLMLLIELIAVMPICDAKLAFMANNNNPLNAHIDTTFGTTIEVPIAGHVAFGYQRDDNKFVFGSFGPSPGNIPLWAPGYLEVKEFDDWAAVERYLIENYYTTYKIFNVDNPNPQNARDTMERFKGSYYNLLTSVVDIKNSPLAGLIGTNSEHPDSENCLTFAKKILEAYGVEDLPPIVPFVTSAPNNYFLSIPGEVHSTIQDTELEASPNVDSDTPLALEDDTSSYSSTQLPSALQTPMADDFSWDTGLWSYSGNAYRDAQNGYIVLTPDKALQVGNIWLNQDITSPFTIEFRYKAGGGTGADGLTLMFYKDKDYDPGKGGCLGFNPRSGEVASGYGVEFDNHENPEFSDPVERHIALIKDSVTNHLRSVGDQRTEDDQWHQVKVEVNTQSIVVYVDGDQVIMFEGDIDRNYGGLGFSAATWTYNDWHLIDDVRIST